MFLEEILTYVYEMMYEYVQIFILSCSCIVACRTFLFQDLCRFLDTTATQPSHGDFFIILTYLCHLPALLAPSKILSCTCYIHHLEECVIAIATPTPTPTPSEGKYKSLLFRMSLRFRPLHDENIERYVHNYSHYCFYSAYPSL